jgi:tRNA(Ser,Leu) C12 N-acetylase TAN1
MAVIDIAQENLHRLEEIKKVVNVEDGVETSLDEVLSRVLNFYRKFVPYG